jgi:hypothetical protein
MFTNGWALTMPILGGLKLVLRLRSRSIKVIETSEESAWQASVMEEEGQEWLKAHPKTSYSDEIRKVLDRWTKHIEKQGNCIDKQDTYIDMAVFWDVAPCSPRRNLSTFQRCLQPPSSRYRFITDYTVQHPRRLSPSYRCRENLKFHQDTCNYCVTVLSK